MSETSFKSLGISDELISGLNKAQINHPTEIQTKVIPLAVEGKDIIAESPTGTGKTLAYLLPLFLKINTVKKEMQSIILCPTHELAMQINQQIKLLADNSGIKVTSLPIIGNANIARQIDKLKGKPHILVGSIGRIHELIVKNKITPQTIKTFIIDEADRMMDDRDIATVKTVLKTTQKDRQILLFSATISQKAIDTARTFMREPKVIKIAQTLKVAETIDHSYFLTDQRDKIELLRKITRSTNLDRALVFLNKGDEIGITVEKLNFIGLKAAGLHSNLDKMARKKAMEQFRDGKLQLLLATDVAARGLDIPGVNYIFNMDMPIDPLSYVHRAGRTGRAEKSGSVISFITHRDSDLIKKFEKELKITIAQKSISGGNIVTK